MTQPTKRCSHCKRIKFVTDFYLFTSRKDGSKTYDTYCKECRKKLNSAKYRREQRERIDSARAFLESIPEGYKLCSACKKVLPLEEFYFLKCKGKHNHCCKECARERARKQCQKEPSKARKGVFRYKDGRMYVFKGYKNGARTLYWSENMLSILKRYFPNTPNAEVAEMIGVSVTTLERKAQELGIAKSKTYLSEIGVRAGRLSGVVLRKKLKQSQQPSVK